jgi:hypothetical protein
MKVLDNNGDMSDVLMLDEFHFKLSPYAYQLGWKNYAMQPLHLNSLEQVNCYS